MYIVTLQCVFINREKGRMLMEKLAIQYGFWSEIRIDTIHAICLIGNDSKFTADTPVTFNHVGTLRTFACLDATICKSMNSNISELREVREELLKAKQQNEEIHIIHLKELRFLATFNLDCLQTNRHKSSTYKQQIEEIKRKLTMELEETKQFLFGQWKETEL